MSKVLIMEVKNIKHIGSDIRNIPENGIYIGRPFKWGNPFKIGQTYQQVLLTRELCISAHRDWLLYSDTGNVLLQDISELVNKDLYCWCKPKECHGDLLLDLARLKLKG